MGSRGAHDPGQERAAFREGRVLTFIAESASIGNEMLLSDYLVANANRLMDQYEKLAAERAPGKAAAR